MVWRLRMHRIRRAYGRAIGFSLASGVIGAALMTVYSILHDHIKHGHSGTHGWILAALGFSLCLAGVGYALHGEAPSVREYAEGESEAMPGISKLLSGLTACGGGMAMFAIGMMNLNM